MLTVAASYRQLIDDVIAAIDVKRLARDEAGRVVREKGRGNANVVDADEAARRRFFLSPCRTVPLCCPPPHASLPRHRQAARPPRVARVRRVYQSLTWQQRPPRNLLKRGAATLISVSTMASPPKLPRYSSLPVIVRVT